MTAQVISSINMKGGIGKTTLTVNLAASLARFHGKRVLVVDLDPQTNATFCLISRETWDKWIASKLILADLMNQTDHSNLSRVEPKVQDAIIKNVGGINRLDLIRSHLKLTFIDISLSTAISRETILKRKLSKVLSEYDFIFCDCPPNLSLSTQNGLAASDYYIIPVFPEPLAALGLGLISNRIKQLNESLEKELLSLGIIYTKYDRRIKETEITSLEIIDANPQEYIFNTRIPENTKIKSAVRSSQPIIITNPKSSASQAYKELAKEFLERIDKMNDSKASE